MGCFFMIMPKFGGDCVVLYSSLFFVLFYLTPPLVWVSQQALGMLLHPIKHYIIIAHCIPISNNDGNSLFAAMTDEIILCAQ